MKTIILTIIFISIYTQIFANDSTKTKVDSVKIVVPKLTVSGNLSISTGYYKMNGLDAPRGQFNPWGINGKINFKTSNGWFVPVTMIYSSQNNRFRQPYNQVGASPLYKNWLVLHGGYRNVYFSPFTLAGHTFLGTGIELNPKKFRFGFIYGKFNRAIENNFAEPDRIPFFKRTGFASRIGVGTKTNYVDLIVLKVADDVNSISLSPDYQYIKPAENLAFGISSRLKIKKKFTFELDGSASAYTRDIRTEAIGEFINIKALDAIHKVFIPRVSTQLSTAFQSAIGYKSKIFNTKIQYKRIEPEFKTMGAYYFQNDIESYTFNPNVSLFKSKLKFNTSIGLQHDNLLNQKKVQTNRLIGSAAIVYAPNENFSTDFLYSNYGITQKAGYLPLIDTLKIAQNNKTLSLNSMYMRIGESTMQTFMLSAIYQELQDLNSRTAIFNENQNWNYNASYSYQNLLSNLDLSINYSYTLTKALDIESVFHGPTASISKRFLKENNLVLTSNLGYMFSQQKIYDYAEKGNVLNASSDISYTFFKKHTLSLNWSLIKSKGVQSFSENRGTIEYQLNF
ncbi:hypothetical protein [Emticicia sp. SJ17W-69]|uniref:hypothetical protein n=1 Tax=Emticicia sp. SJ17W-69 TaxID=3421657 RepID=UPI003EBB2500